MTKVTPEMEISKGKRSSPEKKVSRNPRLKKPQNRDKSPEKQPVFSIYGGKVARKPLNPPQTAWSNEITEPDYKTPRGPSSPNRVRLNKP